MLALAVFIHTTTAFAQPEAFVAPATRAAQLFSEGRELKAAGRIDEACARFEVSWQAEKATGTELNLADCREREGKLLEAWQLFDEAASTSEREGNTTRAAFARNRAHAIDARLMKVDIRLAAPIAKDMAITIDGRAPSALRLRMVPKPMQLRASAPNGKSFMVEIPAQTGHVVVDVPSLVVTETRRRRSRLWIAGGLAVTGVAGLVASQQLFALANEQRDNIAGCTFAPNGRRTCDDLAAVERAERKLALANTNELAGTLVLGGSALAIVGAAVIWYTAPKERVLVTPTATTSSVGVALAASW